MDLTRSYETVLVPAVVSRYSWLEVRNAAAMMAASDRAALADLQTVLTRFSVTVPHLLSAGGGKSQLAKDLDEAFRQLGWRETHMDLTVVTHLTKQPWRPVGEHERDVSTSTIAGTTHKVDNVQRRIAVDVEWNAKDGNLDRDLSAFRALFDAGVIDAGVIITRSFVDMYHVANWLAHHLNRVNVDRQGNEIARLATTTTTNMEKLKPRRQRGDAGGCPVLGVGIAHATYTAGVPYDLGEGRQRSPYVPAPTEDVAADLAGALVADPTDDSDQVADVDDHQA